MTVAFFLDIAVGALLVIAIFYAVKLHRQLQVFKEQRQELQRTVQDLLQATSQAEQAMMGLKINADSVAGKLQKEIDEAQALFDELQFMNDAGNNLAQRLEKAAERAGASAKAAEPKGIEPKAVDKTAAKKNESKVLRSKAEEELLKALKEKKSQ